MDNSNKLYAGHDLDMVRGAVDVQGLWEIKEGDIAHCKILDNTGFVVTTFVSGYYELINLQLSGLIPPDG